MSSSACVEVEWSDDESSEGMAEPFFLESDEHFEPVIEKAPTPIRRSRRKVATPCKVEWPSSDESSDDHGDHDDHESEPSSNHGYQDTQDQEDFDLNVKSEGELDGNEEATVVVLTQGTEVVLPQNTEVVLPESPEDAEPEPVPHVPAKRQVGRPRKKRIVAAPYKRRKTRSAPKEAVSKPVTRAKGKRYGKLKRKAKTKAEISTSKMQQKLNREEELACQCIPCGKTLRNFKEVLKHQKEHKGDNPSYACLQCKKQFRGKRGLREHRRTHSEHKPYACQQCAKAFYHANSLRRHKMTHQGEPQFKCQVCNKCFYERDPCRRHMAHHTATRDFVCDVCGQKFLTALTLKRHHVVHSGSRPFTCEVCGQSFSRSSDLKIHFRAMHTDEKPYSCPICGKEFARSGSLWVHKKTHAEQKAYTCEYCGKSFSQAGYLVEHRRIHTGDRRYVCEVCNRTFTWSGNLREHKKTHLGEKQRCPVCLKEISVCTSMTKHVRKMHGMSLRDEALLSVVPMMKKETSSKKGKENSATDTKDDSHVKKEKSRSQHPIDEEGPISSSVQLPVTVETLQSASDEEMIGDNSTSRLEPGEIVSVPVEIDNLGTGEIIAIETSIVTANRNSVNRGTVITSVHAANEIAKDLNVEAATEMDSNSVDSVENLNPENVIKMDHNVTLMPQQDADIPELIYFQDVGL